MKTKHILLVEDNPADARLFLSLLKQSKVAECTVSVVEDGTQATDYLLRQGKYVSAARPDFILLDLNLPMKNGREVLQEIKQNPNLKSIPVLVFTSSSASEDVNAVYALQASCYLVKPMGLSELTLLIERIQQFWMNTVLLPRNEERGRGSVIAA